jgi:hypothetical protein
MPESVSASAIPEDITFEQAIAFTQVLLTQIEQQTLSAAAVEATIAALVQSENGARGFFVTYLTDRRPLADRPDPGIIQALRAAPEQVADLLVKNLAMSSAMAITHRRSRSEELAQGSDRVRSRSARLMQQLQLAVVIERAQQLQQSLTTGKGAYSAFLDRWGYDAEQRQTIQQAIAEAIDVTPARE